jgi:DNA-binding protein HU-beta|tara:strand:+ start:497 stop:772 length:276 start_codon:yes stop_codon:yes gene_type:complete
MTKSKMIDCLAKSNGEFTKRAITEILDQAMGFIRKELKKNKKFSYPALGTFVVRKRKARKGRNPQTGEEIQIDASKTVGFRAAAAFKGFLN